MPCFGGYSRIQTELTENFGRTFHIFEHAIEECDIYVEGRDNKLQSLVPPLPCPPLSGEQ